MLSKKRLYILLVLVLPFILAPKDGARDVVKSAPNYLDLTGQWYFSTDPQDRGLERGWHAPDLDDSNWERITVPGYREDAGVNAENPGWNSSEGVYNGFVWFRYHFFMPADWRGEEDYYLVMGAVNDYDWTYLNGRLIGLTGSEIEEPSRHTREYRITPDKIDFGQVNILAVRVCDSDGKGGISKGPVIFLKGSHYRAGRWWAEDEDNAGNGNQNYGVHLKVAFNRRSEPLIFDYYHYSAVGENEHGFSLKFKFWEQIDQFPLVMYFDAHFDSIPPDLQIYSYGVTAMLGKPIGLIQPYIGTGFTHTFSGTPVFNRGWYSQIGVEFCEIYFMERQYLSNEEGTSFYRYGWRVKF
ncbi:MAG: sugar-binding domain-containing protein [Bacillota bacterium]